MPDGSWKTAPRFAQFRNYGRIAPSHLWVFPEGSRLHETGATLTDPGRPAKRIEGLKGWLLDLDDQPKPIDIDGSSHLFRKLSKQRAIDLYFERLVDEANVDFDALEELWLLLPAFADDDKRQQYRSRLREAVTHALPEMTSSRFLFEPDMVLEYFRLVRKELELQRSKTEFFLVVDCGAVTCNLTLVISTRSGRITGAKEGRAGMLNSRPGESVLGAGRYVDELIWRRTFGAGKADNESPTFAARVALERAKIECAATRAPIHVTDPTGPATTVNEDLLKTIATELWDNYEPKLRNLLDETHAHFAERRPYSDQFEQDGIVDGSSLGRRLSGLVLAGGTSQLPGFEAELRRRLEVDDETPSFKVGSEYPFVAALGAMAHLLEAKHIALTSDDESEILRSKFVVALQDDVFVALPDGQRGPRVIDRKAWPLDYLDGREAPTPKNWAKKTIKAALAFGAKPAKGPASQADLIYGTHSQNGGLMVFKTGKPAAPLTIIANDHGSSVELHAVDRRQPNTPKVFHFLLDGSPNAHVEPEPAALPFAVLDFGMSKSVLAHSEGTQSLMPDHREYEREVKLPKLAAGWRVSSDPSEVVTPPPRPRRAPTTPQSSAPNAVESLDEQEFLLETCEQLRGISRRDFLALHLAAKTPSPLTLLVGPPGAGKTSLVRVYAAALGYTLENAGLAWVPVQAHWVSEQELAELLSGAWSNLADEEDSLALVLLDEFNLTRPEYYLSNVLAQLEGASDLSKQGLHLPSTGGTHRALFFGTLNIDETSRPPSDKIIDRSFLFELGQTSSIRHVERLVIPTPDRRISPACWARWREGPERLIIPAEIVDLVGELQEIERSVRRSIHETLTPSRRGLTDVAYLLREHERLELEVIDPTFTRDAALDLAVSGRLLPRLRGPAIVMEEALAKLEDYFQAASERWNRCSDRINAMRRQLSEGYVSFWG